MASAYQHKQEFIADLRLTDDDFCEFAADVRRQARELFQFRASALLPAFLGQTVSDSIPVPVPVRGLPPASAFHHGSPQRLVPTFATTPADTTQGAFRPPA